tara:strand:- start:4699 stop:5727 length:1029 start_codon:yes stop_codon:yes gene_type:complete
VTHGNSERQSQESERGAALLIVLLMIATLSVLSVSIVQIVLVSKRSMQLSDAKGQSNWYVLGIEELAKVKLSELWELTQGQVTRYTPGLDIPISFPIDGGNISARIQDRSNCFNLNSLSRPESNLPTGNEEVSANSEAVPTEVYVDLLEALGVGPQEAIRLMSTAADWVDADSQLRAQGAEAGYYASLRKPRSVANTFMVSPQELLDVSGYTPELYRVLAPLVCAKPDDTIGVFNVNTMDERHAPLMYAVFKGLINVEGMIGVMDQQGDLEHPDVETFLEQPTLAQISSEERLTGLLGTTSKHFRVRGEIAYLDAVSSYEALFEIEDTGKVRLLRHRLGVDE